MAWRVSNVPGYTAAAVSGMPPERLTPARFMETAAPRALFFAPFGSYRVHHQLDAVVAASLRLRGAEAAMVGCDGVFRPCDVLTWSGENADRDCASCASSGGQFFSALGLPVFQLSNYIKRSDISAARIWTDSLRPEDYAAACFENFPLGQWCTSSIFSYFRTTPGGLADPKVRETHKGFLITGFLAAHAITRILDEFRPTHLFDFNARFAVYRIAFELARRRGIPVVTHERGFADGTFMLFENHGSIETKPIYDCHANWKDTPLVTAELEGLKKYFDNREAGKDINFTPFVDYRTEYGSVRRMLRIPADAPIFAVFTSSEYEIAYTKDYTTFTSQLDLIAKLIELFRGRKEYLVIRHHPYIAGDAISPPDLEFFNKAFLQSLDLPDNVRIVSPSEKLSSYSLFWSIDACFALLSTVGVEATSRGIPSASFYQSLYRDSLYRIVERDDEPYLRSLVDDLLEHRRAFCAEDLRRAYRFQHSLINKLCLRFASFGIRNYYEADIKITTPEEILPGRDPALDRVCDYVLGKGPLVAVPSAHERARGEDDERLFFGAEIERINSHRELIARKAVEELARTEHEIAVFHHRDSSGAPGSWFKHSRHRCVVRADYDAASPDVALQELSRLVQGGGRKFAALSRGDVWLDESFLSTATDFLGSPENAAVPAVYYGAWIAGPNGRISRTVFSKRFPAQTYEEALTQSEMLRSWQVLLCFGVYRTEILASILDSLAGLTEERRGAAAFKILKANDVRLLEQHGLVLFEH